MNNLARFKNYIWKPYEFKSSRSVENIENEISERIIKEPTIHLLPYYGKLCGKVEKGKFSISYQPLSSLFMRGAGTLTLRGTIEKLEKESRICGHLPGPSAMIWATAIISLGLFGFILIELPLSLFGMGDLLLIWKPILCMAVLFSILTVFIFAFDRGANQQGIEKILAMLRDVAG